MRVGVARAHGERGVEQEHALLRPARQLPALARHVHAQVARYLLEDVLQGGREPYALAHRERQPVRLAGIDVGVLAHDDHFDVRERNVFERREYERARRVDGVVLVFRVQERGYL